jgi:hypothetical protein
VSAELEALRERGRAAGGELEPGELAEMVGALMVRAAIVVFSVAWPRV